MERLLRRRFQSLPHAVAYFLAAALLGASAGCTFVSPYVRLNPKPEPTPADANSSMPQLAKVSALIDSWVDETERQRNTATVTRRVLDVVSFGLLAGAGVKVAHGGSANAVRNYSLGAAGAYMAGSLFVPREQVAAYGDGTQALQCLRSRGKSLLAIVTDAAIVDKDDGLRRKANELAGGAECVDATTRGKLAAAEQAQATARATLAATRGADLSAATKLRSAGESVIIALNKQLDALEPSSDAILGSARSLGQIAAGLAPEASAASAPRVPRDETLRPPPCLQPDQVALGRLQSAIDAKATDYARWTQSLGQALNAVGDLDTSCVFAAEAVPPLALSQDHVVIAKDSSFNVLVSGGREPLRPPVFIGSDSPDQIRVVLVPPRTIVVTGLSKLVAGTHVQVRIADAAAVPSAATLTIDAAK
ncbi:MAG: hypothetical protein ACXWJA_06310 [Caldimonas sp.]